MRSVRSFWSLPFRRLPITIVLPQLLDAKSAFAVKLQGQIGPSRRRHAHHTYEHLTGKWLGHKNSRSSLSTAMPNPTRQCHQSQMRRVARLKAKLSVFEFSRSFEEQ
ncbi:hypothetical protein TraAM80_10209 [Trypanosoma rangeli]|uniref:Uncharacterized protein n=1 Tax=Trypanosoma rangeli TaxID=5698 RepID=A0A3R7K7P3_TRYRA|nr:uncharacterized protein TraAM80_10209 [Trypanosoma rangeli]RNE95467.1 hypothetical protein TraAM80_10209 [Trypanosoma rangeli]|eukprot:RNE95467.1 hypothetical protein TraAM80_10209 [Trypanosoma rangeli]